MTTPLSPTDLATFLSTTRALCDGATEGPWNTVNHEEYHGGMGCTPDGCPGHDTGVAFYVSGPILDPTCDGPGWAGSDETDEQQEARDKEHWKQADADSKFIAHARSAIPVLLDECERLRRERDEALRQVAEQKAEIAELHETIDRQAEHGKEMHVAVQTRDGEFLRDAVLRTVKERDTAQRELAEARRVLGEAHREAISPTSISYEYDHTPTPEARLARIAALLASEGKEGE